MLSGMELTSVSAAGAAAAPAGAPARATGSTRFSLALEDQARRIAARDVLAAMPPMVAEQIQRSTPGGKPPVSAVDALFKAIQSGAFVPSSEQLAASGCLIATTTRAVGAFDSTEQLWATMREMLGAGEPVQDAVRYAAAEQQQQPAPALVTSREQAEAILGGPLPSTQLNWWETAIHFLIDEARAAALRSAPAR